MQYTHFWSFTANYPLAILFTFIPALINVCIFLYVSLSLPKNKSNNTFAFFVLFLGSWQCMEGMSHICVYEDAALGWYRMSEIPTIGVAVFEVLFALRFTGMYRKMSYTLYYTFLILPVILFAMFTVAGFDQFVITKSDFWNWRASPTPSIFTDLMYAWISLASLFTLIIFFVHYLRVREDKIKKTQSLLLLTGFSIPVIGGIMGEVIAPLILKTQSIPLVTPLITCFSITALIAIKRYGLLDYSPRHQWENILETMNEGLVIVNNENQIVYTNKKFSGLTGYPEHELRERSLLSLVTDPTSKEIMIDTFEQHKKNVSSQYQMLLDTKSGAKVWVSVSGFPYKDKNGEIIGSVGVLTDITELMNTQIQLKTKISDLNLFFYKTAHDFKTPIASMQGLLDCYEKDDDIDEFLHYVKLCIQNLSQIVGRVSQLSIIQQKQVIPQDIQNREYIDKIIREVKTETKFNDSIHVDVQLDIETMHAEKYLLNLIIKNLVENGVIYCDAEKKSPFVSVRISREKEFYSIRVADNGVGISIDMQEKIFDMFYRGNDRSKGAGLGLYIVKSAVEKLNGKVSVKSELKQGTEFTVLLPAPVN